MTDMNDTVTRSQTTIPEQRACTRCDGTQHLVATAHGLGKYRCDACDLVIGFDLEATPVEFILHRGLPSRYTKEWFGPRLAREEQRLHPDLRQPAHT